MYRKRDRDQATIDDFIVPFGGKLNADNRWVKMAKLMPWDMIEDIYAKSFKGENPEGRVPISSRIAFGALYIKENENLSDDRTVEHISENNYMQYFLGLPEFNPKPLFDQSMMTWFRKRFNKEDLTKINEEIYRRTHPPKNDPPSGSSGGGKNKGKLILDATVAPADVRYPTDLSLLNECRENTEKMIDSIWDKTERIGHKTSYNRNKARKNYLKVAKNRKPRKRQVRQAIREQLEYVEKNLITLGKLLTEIGIDNLTDSQIERMQTICEVVRQQRYHYENPKESVPDRIINLRQPHVRPMVRGKAGRDVEFGQKLALSVVDGYTFIEEQSWGNFSEGGTLKDSTNKYFKRHGVYPEAILADKKYRNRDNLNFCKEKGIRLSGPRLGRPKASELAKGKEQAYRDNCERNEIEGLIGVNKRRYGLDLIMARLPHSSEAEAVMNVLCMNVAHLLRILLRLLKQQLFPAVFFDYFHRFGRFANSVKIQ